MTAATPSDGSASFDHDLARTATDSFGTVKIPAGVLWGAQTARSLQFFAIGAQRMPSDVIHALAWIKWASANVNRDLRLQDPIKAQAIASAAERVATGEFDAEFPLSVWQTGSGTQSNMNVNEVIATLAIRTLEEGGVTCTAVGTGLNTHPEFGARVCAALTPHIGYDRAAAIAKHAQAHVTTLREAALALGTVTAAQFDAWVDAQNMVGTPRPTIATTMKDAT